MPLYQVGKCRRSFGEWTLSSGRPKPVRRESAPMYFCNRTTEPIEPPSRLKKGRLPQTDSSAFARACTPAESVATKAAPALCKLVNSHLMVLGAFFLRYAFICLNVSSGDWSGTRR